ncbi:hypothetical protein EMIT047CA2_200020 [Pseudomonas soli]
MALPLPATCTLLRFCRVITYPDVVQRCAEQCRAVHAAGENSRGVGWVAWIGRRVGAANELAVRGARRQERTGWIRGDLVDTIRDMGRKRADFAVNSQANSESGTTRRGEQNRVSGLAPR